MGCANGLTVQGIMQQWHSLKRKAYKYDTAIENQVSSIKPEAFA
jgi:hypothetical protein